jgi:hypothetical protein
MYLCCRVLFSILLTLTGSGRVKVPCSEVVILFVLHWVLAQHFPPTLTGSGRGSGIIVVVILFVEYYLAFP